MMPDRTHPDLPTCKALLLCDDTIIEAGTGKISLVGVFTRFILPSIPGMTRPFHAFLQFTDCVGDLEILINIRDLQDDEAIAETDKLGIHVDNRLQTVNLIVPVPSLPIKHAGLYDFVVFTGTDEIDRQQFGAQILQGN